MPDIRYVCLSDLHLGAENSLLSCLVDDQVVVDPTKASPVLDGLIEILRTLIDHNEDRSRKPTLVLNGDVLELALASDNVALMVFELFLDRIFPADGDSLFDPTILYQPGNHDHHVWEMSRERHYGDLIAALPPQAPLPVPLHASRLLYHDDPFPVRSRLLEQLAQRRPDRGAVNFQISYPNMGVLSADAKTAIVFHHGHFAESIYHLMTTLNDAVFPGRPQPRTVDSLEAENFAWIDFFWSTLGRSGDVGDDVGLIYDMLQSDEAIDRVAKNLAAALVHRWSHRGVLGLLRWPISWILDRVVAGVASDVAASERRTPTTPLSAATLAGLSAYLDGPVAAQVAAEVAGAAMPEQMKVVFGHTHKPFLGTTGPAGQTRLFNSGGWVVDTLVAEPLHGANLVLVDENLEVAAIRLYNQARDAAAYQVRMDDGLPDEQGPFYRRLSELLRPEEGEWKAFSTAVAGLVVEREKALATIIANAGQSRSAMRVGRSGT